MPDYLSPSIGMILPQLEQACNDLIRQSLVRALTDYTKQLCEFDPELADILLEGAKTLPRCVRYVMEKAQKAAAQQLEMMTEEEFSALPQATVQGRSASMVGTAISDEQVFEWARAYYYGGKEEEPGSTPAKKNAPAAQDAGTGKKKGRGPKKVKAETQEKAEKAAAGKGVEEAPAEVVQTSLFAA